MARSQPDIMVVGAGVIGLTTALELAQHGLKVLVTDRQAAGQEASWAGAGMLPPGNAPHSSKPEARLRSFSHSLWPSLTARLQELTGRDNGFRVSGSLLFSDNTSTTAELAQQWAEDGVEVCLIEEQQLRDTWPAIHHRHTAAVWLPQQGQVRNPWHLQALRAACEVLNVEFIENTAPLLLEPRGERVESVQLGTDRFFPGQLCITAGAWTSKILKQVGVCPPIRPIRGQMVQLRMAAPLFGCMLEVGRRYLVPRTDGLVLVGSTEEHTGFEKGNTAAGVSELIDFACGLVPELRRQELVRCWSGLRPGSGDDLPLLGQIPGYQNLYVAAGHFRAGLQMSPGTAVILSAILRNSAPPISLTGLSADRFTKTTAAGAHQ
ncbi:MAG: Hydrogen cyanide synthase subunit HcnC precursor [Planctomycetota bacterium]